MAKDAKKRALMKDIDEREAEEAANPSLPVGNPYRGVTAKSALRKAEMQTSMQDPMEYQVLRH
jgi:hypothetical protein